MNQDILRRLDEAFARLDTGVSLSRLRADPLGTINAVLREQGLSMIHDLEEASLKRAVRLLEAA